YATDSLINLVDEKNMNKRELDLLMSCGEIISATVLSSLLRAYGHGNIVLTGYQAGIITDNNFGNANVIDVNPINILNVFKKENIVIVTGFQGATKEGEVTTLGRGGSDTSALILGEALKSDCVEIYTDVEGVMTADPKLVPSAQLIHEICYSEVYQIVEEGAGIIHPKAVEVASRANIKVIIKNIINSGSGTIIGCLNNSEEKQYRLNDNIITGITYKKNRSQVTVYLDDNGVYLKELLDLIADKISSIDLINLFTEFKVFTVDDENVDAIESILDNKGYKYKIIKGCSKISIIGHKINGMPDVMARILGALLSVDVSILQTSDSHTSIWCLLNEKDTEKALNVLHKEFF
ncbi:MAG: aspartate kinase, partial [Tissierellales bacterium]